WTQNVSIALGVVAGRLVGIVHSHPRPGLTNRGAKLRTAHWFLICHNASFSKTAPFFLEDCRRNIQSAPTCRLNNSSTDSESFRPLLVGCEWHPRPGAGHRAVRSAPGLFYIACLKARLERARGLGPALWL